MRDGIIGFVGWKIVDGKDVYQIIVEYPYGPPDDLTFDVIAKSLPVKIVLADAALAEEDTPK